MPKPAALATAAVAAYQDLAGVLVPLIGPAGVDALTSRALHVARSEYPVVETADADDADTPAEAIGPVISWLKQQEEAVLSDAAATVLAVLGDLLMTFIGEPLTMRLFRKAWPDAFSEPEVRGAT